MDLFPNKLSTDEVATMVRNAVADATMQTTLAGHMAQCEKDKAEAKAEALRMHNENTTRMNGFETKIDVLSTENKKIMRGVWMAAGAIAVLQFAVAEGGLGLLAKLFAHAG